ncbi:GlxA family transcriptional regulator [Thioclava sp. BHET1]|uniref:AraC family transcriptional regulator n=2 Tax=Thioclava dalianensis TaxID=1185766 RepID=A0A074TIF6_9RHOB|nr:GlxA family transcriptional regulator [Thioclava dalianensis]KEP71506.1 AraC family transcriptional regulator [Thioclava dalianensis]TMV92915.1 GlxA family transcriptional regulator [Thioclava sp. BHET1]SFN64628.1 Transcriptional regulator GlxA family, contains an amidase domain and an AraC-type DNA-binding HTH domain [Thioclava dalianensis]
MSQSAHRQQRPAPSQGTIKLAAATRTRSFTFLLLERFTMMAFASAIEPLRLANQATGQKLYDWQLVGEAHRDVTCSNGAVFRTDMGLEELPRDSTVLVCGGIDVAETITKPILNWLRREARRGAAMGGLCTGTWALAEAGLLDGRRATIHWENTDAFCEDFPDVELTRSVFVIDGNRLSTAGGTASIDLMLRLIAADHGDELANTVADQMIHSSIRTDRDTQRLSIPTRIGVRHPKLAQVIGRMENNIEDPISPALLATEVGMSARQLERLFRRYLNRSPKRYYMELRLQKARNLLMQTEMSVINVAMACGFASPSHFSKCYRAHYQTTPYRERGTSGGTPEADRALE